MNFGIIMQNPNLMKKQKSVICIKTVLLLDTANFEFNRPITKRKK